MNPFKDKLNGTIEIPRTWRCTLGCSIPEVHSLIKIYLKFWISWTSLFIIIILIVRSGRLYSNYYQRATKAELLVIVRNAIIITIAGVMAFIRLPVLHKSRPPEHHTCQGYRNCNGESLPLMRPLLRTTRPQIKVVYSQWVSTRLQESSLPSNSD